MQFQHPIFLILLFFPLLGFWHSHWKKGSRIRFPNSVAIEKSRPTLRVKIFPIFRSLRWLTIALLAVGFARPQSSHTVQKISTEGIDIILVLDLSRSMLAEDFMPKNRLEAAKLVLRNFLEVRKNDRIGLVAFGKSSITLCPLTTDHKILIDLIDRAKAGMAGDGTAIGSALASATNRLQNSTAKSKIAILLTDGDNNSGEIAPMIAAEIAREIGIKIYAIGLGKDDFARIPFPHDVFGVQYRRVEARVNSQLLSKIARRTEGNYFRATDQQKLSEIYSEIDQLETTKIESTEIERNELANFFVISATCIFLIELVLANTIMRKIP